VIWLAKKGSCLAREPASQLTSSRAELRAKILRANFEPSLLRAKDFRASSEPSFSRAFSSYTSEPSRAEPSLARSHPYNILIIQKCSSMSYLSVVGILWNVFSALVIGGRLPKGSKDNGKSYKMIMLTSMLGGLVIWIAYRSFLSAELAIVIKKYPFNDLESLSKTKFR